MKINETVAHVRARDFELSVGERVRLVRRVELAPGSTFVEGDEVEKLPPSADGGPQAP